MKSIVGGSNCLKKRLLMMRNCIHQAMKLYAQENLSKKLETISIRFKMYSLPNYLECYLNILTMATNTIFHPSKSGKINLKKNWASNHYSPWPWIDFFYHLSVKCVNSRTALNWMYIRKMSFNFKTEFERLIDQYKFLLNHNNNINTFVTLASGMCI